MTDPGAAIEAPDPTACRNARARVASGERSTLDIARRIVELAEDKKAADIVLLDLTGLTTIADNFVICSAGSGGSSTSRRWDHRGLRAEERPIRREGLAVSHWVLVDFGSTIVHIFTPPSGTSTDSRSTGPTKTILRVQ